jgi:monoamine oxidase
MAAGLVGVISYGEHLIGVQQDADGALVHTDRRTLTADHVVLACSLVPLRSVQFHDQLPPALHAAVHQLGYGTVTKTSVQWPRRSWPAGYATTSGTAQRVYEPTVDQPGEPWGRVQLAGEHVAACTGYMEGALESAETVVARIVAAG